MKLEITRRNILKWAGFLGVGFVLPRSLKGKVLTPKEKPLPHLDSESFVPTLCPLCPSQCMLQIRVVDGKAVGLSGTPRHPMSQGGFCPKGGALLQDVYHPDRLKHPLKRRGRRGENQWEEISWKEADSALQAKLRELLALRKPEALGILSTSKRDFHFYAQRRFAQSFGTPNFWEWNWPLNQPPLDAFRQLHGSPNAFYDLENAGLIVSFGWDWLNAFPSPIEAQRIFADLRRGRAEKRSRILQIESRLSTTAAKADRWIAVKPGTEGLVALGVAHTLMEEELFDKEFVRKWVPNFEEFRRLVFERFSRDTISRQSGVEPHKMSQVAHELASVKPALVITSRGSLFNQLAVQSLNVLLGNIGSRGGVVPAQSPTHNRLLAEKTPPLAKKPLVADPHQIPEVLLEYKSPPVEQLWLDGINPVFLSPQPSLWERALQKVSFTVSFTSFIDESAKWADLIVPLQSPLEAGQFGVARTSHGEDILSVAPPVLPPPLGSVNHTDFLIKLAHSLGSSMTSVFPWNGAEQAMDEVMKKSKVKGNLKEGIWRNVKPSSLGLKKISLPIKLFMAREPHLPSPSFPLKLYVYAPLAYSFGEGAHLPYLQSLAGAHLGEEWETWLEIHPETARRFGIKDGQMVWIESTQGKIKARGRYYIGIQKDTVSLPLGLGHQEMGRYAKGIGSNPGRIIEKKISRSHQPLWQETEVKVYVA